MHRIDTPDATPDHRFTEGDPTIPLPATMVSADWLNAVQEELSGVIEGAGLTLDKVRHDQLKAAITKMITDRAAPLATTEQAGLVERATDAEAQAGTDGERYVTPKQLKDAVGTTDMTAFIRDMRAGDIVMRGHATIRTLNDGLPEALELNGDVVSLATFPRLMRVWWGDAQNATAPAFYRCNAGGIRDAAGTHIKLPDLRGEYPKGWDHGRGVDAGRVLASWTAGQLLRHGHRLLSGDRLDANAIGFGASQWNIRGVAGVVDATNLNYYTKDVHDTGTRLIEESGGTENLVRGVALMFIIYV